MQEGRGQGREVGAGEPDASKNGELSDDVMEEIAGGRSDAAVRMGVGKEINPADNPSMPVNELLGKVRSINYA